MSTATPFNQSTALASSLSLQTTILTFDELPFQPVSDLTYQGVTFGFTIAGSASTDANYNASGPGAITYIQDPSLEGDAAGILSLNFANPVSNLQFGLSLDSFNAVTAGAVVSLFDSTRTTLLGVIPINTTPLSTFTEGLFTYTGSPVGLAVIDFDEALVPRFSIDNLVFNAPPSGAGSTNTFTVNADQTVFFTEFGGVGRGVNPSSETIAEVDALQFSGVGLTPQNLLLTQVGSNLEITFEGSSTKVTLQDFALENLDNLLQPTASANIGNILFDGQTPMQDSFDVFDAESTLDQIFNRNSVTFLNDLDNTTSGFNNSNDVINAQAGNDYINGLSGDDLLRGGAGNDTLVGGVGNDTLVGGSDSDRFALSVDGGTDTIRDFVQGEDLIQLIPDLTFAQLTITQGTGADSSNTLINFNNGSNTELLGILINVQANSITIADFIPT